MNVRRLSEALQKKAEVELNEIPNKVEQNLNLLKNWLEKQEYLIYKNDDQWLLNFLRASKFSLERTKEKLDAYYTFRILAPELARNWDPLTKDTQTHLGSTATIPLPTPENDPAAPRVMFCSYGDYDPDVTTFTTMIHAENMSINVLMNNDDNYVVAGVIIVWDLKGLKLKSALQATPTFIKKLVFCYEKAFPTRLKGVYIINVPKYFEQALNLIKPLASKKLAERLHFYSTNNLEIIFERIPKSIFPNEYGGDAGCLEDLRAKWKKTIEDHREMLLTENNYYSDESKRPEKSRNLEDIFGIEGSFRNLEID